MASNPQFLLDMKLADESESKKVADESFKVLRLEQLTFSRWAQVMYRFEKSLYDNPDQDLNKLWWDLVENMNMLNVLLKAVTNLIGQVKFISQRLLATTTTTSW